MEDIKMNEILKVLIKAFDSATALKAIVDFEKNITSSNIREKYINILNLELKNIDNQYDKIEDDIRKNIHNFSEKNYYISKAMNNRKKEKVKIKLEYFITDMVIILIKPLLVIVSILIYIKSNQKKQVVNVQ